MLRVEEVQEGDLFVLVQDFCVNEADAWFNGFEDDSKENRLLFAKILFDKLNLKFK